MNHSTPKVALVCCYFGNLPAYFNYFLHSALKNKEIDFFIFNDKAARETDYGNVKIITLSIEQFHQLSFEKLGFSVHIKEHYKLCDFKPAYGKIFEDYLQGYDFWGYGDVDIIYGDVKKFLPAGIFNECDVITTTANWTAGHFTLIRNNLKELFRQSPSYKEVFLSGKYEQFDESCRRWDGVSYDFEDLIKKGLYVSMFDVVKLLERKGELKLCVVNHIREHLDPVNYAYKDGALIDLSNGEEFFYYHFFFQRKSWRFFMPAYKKLPAHFFVTPLGIMSQAEKNNYLNRCVWHIKRIFHCAKAIMKSIKSQSFAETKNKLHREIRKVSA